MSLKFTFNEDKALSALCFVASVEPNLSPLFVSKVFFFAEKEHINRYGRPIIGDTFIAMPRGPVPSTIKNYIDENWMWVGKPEKFDEAISLTWVSGLKTLDVGRNPITQDFLSETDKECLSEAIAFCKHKSARELSEITHFEKSWLNAPENRPMDYEDFVDEENPHRPQILEAMKESAAYGVF
jgi:uncharacterized phage-associated protein